MLFGMFNMGKARVGNVQHGEVTTSIGNDVYVGPMTTRSDIYIARRGKYPFRYSLDEPLRKWSMSMNGILMRRGSRCIGIWGKFIDQWNFKEAYPKLYKEYLGRISCLNK